MVEVKQMSFIDDLLDAQEKSEKKIPVLKPEEFLKFCKDAKAVLKVDLKALLEVVRECPNLYITLKNSELDAKVTVRTVIVTPSFEVEVEYPSGSKKFMIPKSYFTVKRCR